MMAATDRPHNLQLSCIILRRKAECFLQAEFVTYKIVLPIFRIFVYTYILKKYINRSTFFISRALQLMYEFKCKIVHNFCLD